MAISPDRVFIFRMLLFPFSHTLPNSNQIHTGFLIYERGIAGLWKIPVVQPAWKQTGNTQIYGFAAQYLSGPDQPTPGKLLQETGEMQDPSPCTHPEPVHPEQQEIHSGLRRVKQDARP